MAWKEKVKDWAPGNLAFLSTDGAALRFIVVGDPEKLDGVYKNKPQVRIACPIVTEEGFAYFVTGKRVFRKLASLESKFKDHVFTIVRKGEEGDPNAAYPISYEKDVELVKKLKALGKKEMTGELLSDALEAAREVVNS